MDGLWKNMIISVNIIFASNISGVPVSSVTWQSELPKHVVTVSEYPTKKTVKVKLAL
jgi:hypothetical protein